MTLIYIGIDRHTIENSNLGIFVSKHYVNLEKQKYEIHLDLDYIIVNKLFENKKLNIQCGFENGVKRYYIAIDCGLEKRIIFFFETENYKKFGFEIHLLFPFNFKSIILNGMPVNEKRINSGLIDYGIIIQIKDVK